MRELAKKGWVETSKRLNYFIGRSRKIIIISLLFFLSFVYHLIFFLFTIVYVLLIDNTYLSFLFLLYHFLHLLFYLFIFFISFFYFYALFTQFHNLKHCGQNRLNKCGPRFKDNLRFIGRLPRMHKDLIDI